MKATAASEPLRVLIVGGGPAGSSCAISLVRLAAQLGRTVKVTLFEHKTFGTHYNQCMGVLSPPIVQLMEEYLGLPFPRELVLREIEGYWLHTENRSIYLSDTSSEHPEPSLATRRVYLDGFLLSKVQTAGVEVVVDRVVDMEFTGDSVQLYTEGGSYEADVLVGAFGLDRTMGEALGRRTGYRAPDFLDTVVTKIHPGLEIVNSFGNRIHAFLPKRLDIEFAALVPKRNHITALIAGRKVTSGTLLEFLKSPSCSAVLNFPYEVQKVFKGNFPICPAKNFYGDRYITVGDSAGLVRPFKGKGINIAISSGYYAARNILERGITREALSQIEVDFAEQIGDLWYGRAARWLARYLSFFSFFDPVIEVAGHNENLRQALFDSVSAHNTYRSVLRRVTSSPRLILELTGAVGLSLLRGKQPRA